MPSANPRAGLRPFTPTRFGRYTLLAPLATGGMAQVFLARATGVEGFEKLVVIKKILSHLAEDEYFVDRFLDEGKIVVKLQHGSIAQVIDMGKEGEEYYIAMEFVDGKDLRKIAARCRDQKLLLPTGLALYVFVRLLDALAYAHRKKDDQDRDLHLVHRDVSPQNILVSYEGEVKIIDFGLAKSALSLARTSPSVILGKFFYMSPEQARHQPADRRSDLYATGICLWEMLAGRNPFDDTPPGEILRMVANPSIPPLKEVCPDVAQGLNEVLLRALAPDPERRFQTAEEMRGQLTTAMLEADPTAGPEALAAFMRERFQRELENERKMLAVLGKLPSPSEPTAPPPAAPDADEDLATPPPTGATRRAAAPPKPPKADTERETPTRGQSTGAETSAPELDGCEATPVPGGPVVVGGTANAGSPRRSNPPKQKAAAAGAAAAQAVDLRATFKHDPLEFVPGEASRSGLGRREDQRARLGGPAGAEPRTPRPGPRPRLASKPSQPAEPPAPDTNPNLEAAAPTTSPNIIVAQELSAPAASQEPLAAEPQQDGRPASATPLAVPVFSSSTTPRGTDLLRGGNLLTIVLVLVGMLCMVAAAAIAVVVFKPSWLSKSGSSEPSAAKATAQEPEPEPTREPAPFVSFAPAPSRNPSAAAAPANSAVPAPKPAPAALADESAIAEPPSPPYPRKATMSRAEIERWSDDLDKRFRELSEKYPTERMLRLTLAHRLLKKKRAQLATPAGDAELQVWLGWFEKSVSQTRRRLER